MFEINHERLKRKNIRQENQQQKKALLFVVVGTGSQFYLHEIHQEKYPFLLFFLYSNNSPFLCLSFMCVCVHKILVGILLFTRTRKNTTPFMSFFFLITRIIFPNKREKKAYHLTVAANMFKSCSLNKLKNKTKKQNGLKFDTF